MLAAINPKQMFKPFNKAEPDSFAMNEFIHMECTKVTVLGEKKIALCNAPSFVLTDDVKKVTCPKCKSIIKLTTKKKRLGYKV